MKLCPPTKIVKLKGVIGDHCLTLTPQGIQHKVIADSHPYSYQTCLTGLNFREQWGTMLSAKESIARNKYTRILNTFSIIPSCERLKTFATTPQLNRLERC